MYGMHTCLACNDVDARRAVIGSATTFVSAMCRRCMCFFSLCPPTRAHTRTHAHARTHVRTHTRTQAAQEDLRRAELREQSDGQIAAITKLHAEQAQADKGEADRQLEEVTQRLREAERTLAQVASRPAEAPAGLPLAGGGAGEGRGTVVDELMQRLRCVCVCVRVWSRHWQCMRRSV